MGKVIYCQPLDETSKLCNLCVKWKAKKRISCSFSIKTLHNLHNFYDPSKRANFIILFEKWQSLRLYNIAPNVELMCERNVNRNFPLSTFRFHILPMHIVVSFAFCSYYHAISFIRYSIFLQRRNDWCMT